jgi:hypothetical protein
MTSRNFKVRIENLNLKKTVFLETAKHPSNLLNKYRDMLHSLGYQYLRGARKRGGKHQIYYFYSSKIFPTQRAYHKKFPRVQRVRVPGARGRIAFTEQVVNEYLVELHIVQLTVKRRPE